MKTIKVRPILVDSKGHCLSILPNKQLILISLDDEIKVGDKHYFEGEVKYTTKQTIEYLNSSGDNTFKKVIATQEQISPEYIQQFIEEYNKGKVKDFEIEMKDWCDYDDNPCGGLDKPDWRPKLTNGFVTIVNNSFRTRS